MTDKDTILEILKRRGIEYEETVGEGIIAVEIYEGYVGFYTRMTFSKDGELQKVEAFE